MDRKKYGEIIVDQIINDYKNSKEFRDDARHFLYRWLTCILNYKTADLGNCFVNGLNGTMTVPEENQQKFMEGMDKYNDLRAKMDELDAMLDDEANIYMYPIFFNR